MEKNQELASIQHNANHGLKKSLILHREDSTNIYYSSFLLKYTYFNRDPDNGYANLRPQFTL